MRCSVVSHIFHSEVCKFHDHAICTFQKMGLKLVILVLLGVLSINFDFCTGSCLCHVVPNFSCPPPPNCCESGMYSYDECGCCLVCAKSELRSCGGGQNNQGYCAKGLACLKTCCKYFKPTTYFCIFSFL